MNNKNTKIEKDNDINFQMKKIIFFIPLILISIIFSVKAIFGPTYQPYLKLIVEDGIMEYSTVLIYIITFFLSLLIANSFLKSKQNLYSFLYYLLAVSFMLIAIEEISWGQRIFHIKTPDIFSESTQNEMNLHDLPPFAYIEDSAFIIVGFVGSFFWISLSSVHRKKMQVFKKFFVPQWYLMSYFLPVSLFYLILNLTPPEQISSNSIYWNFLFPKEQEFFEFLLSVGILIFILVNLRIRPCRNHAKITT